MAYCSAPRFGSFFFGRLHPGELVVNCVMKAVMKPILFKHVGRCADSPKLCLNLMYCTALMGRSWQFTTWLGGKMRQRVDGSLFQSCCSGLGVCAWSKLSCWGIVDRCCLRSVGVKKGPPIPSPPHFEFQTSPSLQGSRVLSQPGTLRRGLVLV